MEQYNDELLPYLAKFENAIETHDEEMTLDTIIQIKQRLSSIVLRLNNIHNSKLTINKLPADILYNIFALAAQSSPFAIGTCSSGMTAVRISSVCRHWRTCALEWTALWRSIDIPCSLPFLEFLKSRSGDAPIALTWANPPHQIRHDFDTGSVIIPSLFSRLRYLTLHVHWADFDKFQRACQGFKIPPLPVQQLQYLDATVHDQIEEALLTDFLPIDIFCLHKLKLRQIYLPWLTLPRSHVRNNLADLTLSYHSVNLPNLSHLLIFLSNCPLLNFLKLNVSKKYSKASSPISGETISTLDFQHLRTLILESEGIEGYGYIGQFAACIRAPFLSHFRRYYTDAAQSPPRNLSRNSTHRAPPLHLDVFETIPPGTLSQFADIGYLSITIGDYHFEITGSKHKPPTSRYIEEQHPLVPLDIYGEAHAPLFDYSQVINLIQNLPKLTHLKLRSSAWSIFNSLSDTEIRTVFPCLHTLELFPCLEIGRPALSSPLSYLKPRTLILDTLEGIPSSDDSFLNTVLKMQVKVLVLEKACYKEARDSELVNALVTKGIHAKLE